MATLTELAGLYGDGDLEIKVSAAIIIRAYELLTGSPGPTASQRAYAAKVFQGPRAEAQRVLKYVLAANSALSTAAIQGASDAAIQAQVNLAVDELIQADAGT